MHATASLLPALGLEPILGRNFSADEDRAGGEHVALISPRLWQERFNGSPAAIGQRMVLGTARQLTLLGIAVGCIGVHGFPVDAAGPA